MELLSYSEATRLATLNKGIVYAIDAGQGFVTNVVWVAAIGRLQFTQYNADGAML